MKKRLFLSSAIMTAVLAGALTTGTFAWYAATQGNAQGSHHQVSNLSTATNTYEIGGVTFTPTLTATGNPKMSDDNGVTKHYVGNAVITDASQPAASAMYGTGTVKIDSDAAVTEGATIAQIMDELGAKTGFTYAIVTIKAYSTYVEYGNAGNVQDTRVKFFKEAPEVKAGGFAGPDTLQFVVTISNVESTAVLASTNYWWAYDGTDGTSDTKDAANITGLTFEAVVSFSDTNPLA